MEYFKEIKEVELKDYLIGITSRFTQEDQDARTA